MEFTTSKNKVKIICPIHGLFEQIANKHLSKKGCPQCGFISRCNKARSNSKKFIDKANLIHNFKYDYSKVEYYGKEIKVSIICNIHGLFNQTPHNHLAKNGCPRCKESKGEKEIEDYFIKNHIKYVRQKRFDDCRHILPLPFDFYLPSHNTCIEYQGIQHFKSRTKFGGDEEFNKVKIRDGIKFNYCLDKNILLILINYSENVVDILNSLFNSDILKTST